jgi:hypothetical protein
MVGALKRIAKVVFPFAVREIFNDEKAIEEGGVQGRVRVSVQQISPHCTSSIATCEGKPQLEE